MRDDFIEQFSFIILNLFIIFLVLMKGLIQLVPLHQIELIVESISSSSLRPTNHGQIYRILSFVLRFSLLRFISEVFEPLVLFTIPIGQEPVTREAGVFNI